MNRTGQGDATECLELRIVGHVRNEVERPILEVRQGDLVLGPTLHEAAGEIERVGKVSRIIIAPELEDMLQGIEGYSHLVVLYWAHEVPESGRGLTKVHPMGRSELAIQGVCCTCSPARPNPVLLCVVRLLSRQGNVLEVSGCDAIDGSPVIDIKPYVAEFYPRQEVAIPDWMRNLLKEMDELMENAALE